MGTSNSSRARWGQEPQREAVGPAAGSGEPVSVAGTTGLDAHLVNAGPARLVDADLLLLIEGRPSCGGPMISERYWCPCALSHPHPDSHSFSGGGGRRGGSGSRSGSLPAYCKAVAFQHERCLPARQRPHERSLTSPSRIGLVGEHLDARAAIAIGRRGRSHIRQDKPLADVSPAVDGSSSRPNPLGIERQVEGLLPLPATSFFI